MITYNFNRIWDHLFYHYLTEVWCLLWSHIYFSVECIAIKSLDLVYQGNFVMKYLDIIRTHKLFLVV